MAGARGVEERQTTPRDHGPAKPQRKPQEIHQNLTKTKGKVHCNFLELCEVYCLKSSQMIGSVLFSSKSIQERFFVNSLDECQ